MQLNKTICITSIPSPPPWMLLWRSRWSRRPHSTESKPGGWGWTWAGKDGPSLQVTSELPARRNAAPPGTAEEEQKDCVNVISILKCSPYVQYFKWKTVRYQRQREEQSIYVYHKPYWLIFHFIVAYSTMRSETQHFHLWNLKKVLTFSWRSRHYFLQLNQISFLVILKLRCFKYFAANFPNLHSGLEK